MSRIPKLFRFQQDFRIPSAHLSIQDIHVIHQALMGGNKDLAFHYASEISTRGISMLCGAIYHDQTEIEVGQDYIQVRLFGVLFPEHTQALAPKLLGDRLFPTIPLIHRPDPDTGESSVIGVANPILRYVQPPPALGINKKSRVKYITLTTYSDYLKQLDMKEGRTSTTEALDGRR